MTSYITHTGRKRTPALVRRMDRRWYPNETSHSDAKRFRRYVEQRLKPQYALLDYGAGRGAHAEFDFRGLVSRVVGVDVDPAVLKNPQVHVSAMLEAPDYAVPFADESFDAIVSMNVVEHLPNPEASFCELTRVLRRGGVILIKTTNLHHYIGTVARATPAALHRWYNARWGTSPNHVLPTTYRCNTRRAVAEVAQSAELEVVDFSLHEGRPEYLRGNPLTYGAGLLYERIVNLTPKLEDFRAVIFATLMKPIP
jgi:SAM-dependent methyltransferase